MIGAPSAAMEAEAQLLRQFLLERRQAGVDVFPLVMAQAIVLGQNIAVCAAEGFLESTVDQVMMTMRYNALLSGPEAGNG